MQHEPSEAEQPRNHAIHAERREPAAPFEIAHQESHAQIGRNRGQHAAEQRVGELVARMEQLGQFKHARREDDRRAEQEREFRGLLCGQAGRVARNHRQAAARKAGNQRADLRETDEKRLLECQLLGRPMRAAALDTIADPQQHAVDDQCDRNDPQIVEHAFDALLEQQPDDARRNRADDQRPHQMPVVVLAPAEMREEPADQRDPARAEIPEQRERGAQMQRNEKRQQLRRVLVDMHAEQRRHEQRMAETADGKEFGHALQDAQENQKPETHASVLSVEMEREEMTDAAVRVRENAPRLCRAIMTAPRHLAA